MRGRPGVPTTCSGISTMLTRSSPAAAVPHMVHRDVLGEAIVASLLDYVAARQADFNPAVVRDRGSGERRVDSGVRSSLSLADLGPFRAPIESYVSGIASAALRLFNIAAYRDSDRFGAHIDTNERLKSVRVLSCVYYFSPTPRRFSGGELRLYGLPTLSKAAAPAFV